MDLRKLRRDTVLESGQRFWEVLFGKVKMGIFENEVSDAKHGL